MSAGKLPIDGSKGFVFWNFLVFFDLLFWAGQYPSAIVFCVAYGKSAKTIERNILLVQMAAVHFCKAIHFSQTNMNKLSQNVNEPKMLRMLIRMKSVKLDANQYLLDIYWSYIVFCYDLGVIYYVWSGECFYTDEYPLRRAKRKQTANISGEKPGHLKILCAFMCLLHSLNLWCFIFCSSF